MTSPASLSPTVAALLRSRRAELRNEIIPLAFGGHSSPEIAMATRRAYWKGYLKLSLVTCPVALYPGVFPIREDALSPDQPQDRQPPAPADGGRRDRPRRGQGEQGTRLRAGNGKYVEIEPEELEAVEIESTHTIDIDKFVPEEDIDKRYYERPLLHRTGRQERRGGFRCHPRRDEGQGPGRARTHRVREPRAHPCHRTLGQGHAGHDAALRLRSAGRERVLQRHSEARA